MDDGNPKSPSRGRAMAAVALIRSPESGLLGQGIRFALAGGTVACVYLLTTLLLATVVGIPFQGALAIGFTAALSTHFTLQRLFVWVHHDEFALSFRAQAGRYLAIAFTQYVVTAATTAALPKLLDVSAVVVYVCVTAVITVTNFVLFRTRVFHAES